MKTLISSVMMLLLFGQPASAQTLDFSPNHSVVLCGPTDVYFVCQSDQTLHNIWWDFGDGSIATGVNAVHQYTRVGVYDVKMVVEINGVKDSITKTAFVTVNPLPEVMFTVGTDPVPVPYIRNLTYTGTPDEIVSYRWKVDGALVSTHSNCKFLFPSNGIYTVSLEVTHQLGCVNSHDTTVTINDNPIPQTALAETQQQPYACTMSNERNELLVTRNGNTSEPLTIRLFDITGRLLNTYTMSASSTELRIELTSEVPTMLVVELANRSFEAVQKLHPRYL